MDYTTVLFYRATSDGEGLHWLQLPHDPVWPAVKAWEFFIFPIFVPCTWQDVWVCVLKRTAPMFCKYIHLLGQMDLYLPIAVYFSLNCKTCYFGATGQITHTEMI